MGGWIIMPGSCSSGFSPMPSGGGVARIRNGEDTKLKSPVKKTITAAITIATAS